MEKDFLQTLSDLLDTKLEPINSRLDETYQIIKAIEHSAEVNKAELDKISKSKQLKRM